ncbi:MAG: glycosyltransferase, partial [Candidatus Hydrogenedentes bacterium]|nr:glycosyltransferase [Candidatus Hydrogenedentota bacterium]
EMYKQSLADSRIGLSFFGFGFDTVRYWELAAHGCMLLAERPLVRIPFNFIAGESANFFDDLPELEQKLAHYLAHPDEAQMIATAGHSHFLKYHTTSARARQFLGRIQMIMK